MPNNPSRMQIIPLLLAFIRSLLNANLCTALFTRSGGGEGALSPQDGAAIAVALSNLMTPNKISTSKHYYSGLAIAEVHKLTTPNVVITRYVRWTEYCTVGTYESVPGQWLLRDFKATIPYLRPYALQGYSWASVSNAYAFLDYYVTDNYNNSSHVDFLDVMASDHGLIETRKWCSHSNFETPMEKTGFVDFPLWPFLLLSHDNGVWNGLAPGEYLTSPDKRIRLEMERGCNLVLTDTQYSRMLWHSNTAGDVDQLCFLRLQSDGNLAIYDSSSNSTLVWSISEGCGYGCIKFSALVVWVFYGGCDALQNRVLLSSR
ncbi:hypothetical protein KI387_001200, partial [Taxus chinensis]